MGIREGFKTAMALHSASMPCGNANQLNSATGRFPNSSPAECFIRAYFASHKKKQKPCVPASNRQACNYRTLPSVLHINRVSSLPIYCYISICRPGATQESYIVRYFMVTQGVYTVAVKPSPHNEPLMEVHQWPKKVS